MKVFVSYSRADVAFADQLVLALEDRGFNAILDRHDIDAAENWKDRLGGLILSCDAVAFVLTERSAASSICAWEVDEARKLGKRIIPCVPGEVSAAPPAALADLNWIHFYSTPAIPGSGMFDGLRKLERALKIDLDWLRKQTVWQEQALRWGGRGQAADSPYLLRGDLLTEALAWAGETPAYETVPPQVAAFLAASEAAEARLKAEATAGLAEREAALKKAAAASASVRRVGFIGAGVAALFLVAALVAGWFALQNLSEAERQSAAAARKSSDILARESEAMREATPDTAVLMALQADPAAARFPNLHRFAQDGHPSARASLAAAQEVNRLQFVLRGHGEAVYSATFSSDGKRIVTASKDNTARVWDAVNGKQVLTLSGHGDRVWSATFSRDGARIATVSADNTARVWDAATGKALITLSGHNGLNRPGNPGGHLVLVTQR